MKIKIDSWCIRYAEFHLLNLIFGLTKNEEKTCSTRLKIPFFWFFFGVLAVILPDEVIIV